VPVRTLKEIGKKLTFSTSTAVVIWVVSPPVY